MPDRSENTVIQIIRDHKEIDTVFEHFIALWEDFIVRCNFFDWEVLEKQEKLLLLKTFDAKHVLAERTFVVVHDQCLGQVDFFINHNEDNKTHFWTVFINTNGYFSAETIFGRDTVIFNAYHNDHFDYFMRLLINKYLDLHESKQP